MSQIQHFDAVAERYDRLRSPDEVTPLLEMLAREGNLAGRAVLDIGCGTAANSALLAQHFGCRVTGIDPSPGMLAEARARRPAVDVVEGVAEQLPFPDESFDAALMMVVAHHLDRRRAFPEARRVLLPGGRLLISTPNPEAFERFWLAALFPSYVDIERERFPTAAMLEDELRRAGFPLVRLLRLSVPRSFTRAYALERIRGRYASTFEHMSDEEYRAGLDRAEHELTDPVEYVLESVVVVAYR